MTTTWIWGDLDDMIFADCDWEISQREHHAMCVGFCFLWGSFRAVSTAFAPFI